MATASNVPTAASLIPELGSDPVEAVRRGLPVTALLHVQEILQAPDDALARALGISRRTLSRRRETDTLTTDASDRLLQLATIVALAQQALDGTEGARTWLRTSHALLGGESPLQRMDTLAGMDQVNTLLYHIEYGLPV